MEVSVAEKKKLANAPLGVLYVEVNGANVANSLCYSVDVVNQPLFDITIIFAANINYDVGNRRAILHFNNQVTAVLNDLDRFVRPIQARGTKVLLSILGNHQGAGFCNFPDEASATDFAGQLRDAVVRYGLDGIDFDDEYADYGNNGTGQPNDSSFLYLLRALRNMIPDKIISFYYYGPAASRLEWNGMIAGTYVNYSWNAMYGTYSPPNVPGLNRSQLGPAATWVEHTGQDTANRNATRTVQDGYGVYLYYDLPNANSNNFLSGISSALYGWGSSVAGGCLINWPPPKPETPGGPSLQPNMREWNREDEEQSQ